MSPGAGDAPEVFTVWVITFNDSSLCTDEQCDVDDLAPDAAARGGVYQLDGRVADGDTLHFAGNVRLGQAPFTGSPLDDPLRAVVHLLIAPHGRALSGEDGWRQLNGPRRQPLPLVGGRVPHAVTPACRSPFDVQCRASRHHQPRLPETERSVDPGVDSLDCETVDAQIAG